MAIQTPTIGSQVHAYERNHPERPWIGSLRGPDEVTGDDMVAAMDTVGVDGALLVSPYSMYRYDASYALQVYEKHPGRFGLIKPFDPNSKTIADEIAEWEETKGVVGARIMLTYQPFEADDPGHVLPGGCATACSRCAPDARLLDELLQVPASDQDAACAAPSIETPFAEVLVAVAQVSIPAASTIFSPARGPTPKTLL